MATSVETPFTATVLTANYADNRATFRSGPGQLILLASYTKTTGTAAQVLIETSHDGTTYFTPANSAGTLAAHIVTIPATSSVRVNMSGLLVGSEATGDITSGESYLRVSVKETGTPGGTITVRVLHAPHPSYAT